MKKRYLSILAIVLSLSLAFVFCAPSNIYAYDEDYDEYDDYDDDYDYDDYDDYDDEYTYYNTKYHRDSFGDLEEHSWEEDYVIKKASITQKGKIQYYCDWCGGTKTVYYSWKLASPYNSYHKSYNILRHTLIYPSTKTVTVWLHNVLIGSVVKVKIGSKVYSKKVGTSKKVTIKINPPKKYGYSVSMGVWYNGKCIGGTYYYDSDDAYYYKETGEIVYSGYDIKKGMTKTKVKYLYWWGPPSRTASASGGWSYWYYGDGSRITFKNGKVYSWYDASR